MRGIVIILVFMVLASLAVAAESPEATAKRIADLQKANLVLQEDLARTQLELNATQSNLRSEAAARKELGTVLAQEKAAREAREAELTAAILAARQDADTKHDALAERMAGKMTEMQAALDKSNETISGLELALHTERDARLAAENEADALRARQNKQAKRDRMLTFFGILLGGAAIAK